MEQYRHPEEKWEALKRLVTEEELTASDIESLVNEINFGRTSAEFLIYEVLPSSIIAKSLKAQNHVESGFSDGRVVIRPVNFFPLLKKAEEEGLLQLTTVKNKFVDAFWEDFETLCFGEGFVRLSVVEMSLIFESKKWRMVSEKTRWEALLRWVRHDETRTADFYDIFKLLEINLLSSEFLTNTVLKEPIVLGCDRSISLVNNFEQTWRADQDLSPGKIMEVQIATIFRHGSFVNTFKSCSRSWSRLPSVPKDIFYGLVSVNETIHLLGDRCTYRFNFDNTVSYLPSCPLANESSQVVSLQGCIYVLTTSKLLMFDSYEKVWKELPRYFDCEEGFVTAASEREIFVLGRSRSNRRNLSYYYSVDTRVWTEFTSMRRSTPYHAAAAYLREILYVMGGYESREDRSPLNITCCYDFQVCSWSKLCKPSMISSRARFSAVTIGDVIYAVGGARDGDGNDCIEAFDILTNEWKFVTFVTCPVPQDKVTCCYACPHVMLKTIQKRKRTSKQKKKKKKRSRNI